MRSDKFLWCIRQFRTRSLATGVCRKGHIRVNDKVVKAGTEVHEGDVISIRTPPVWRSYRIKAIPKSRVGAKLVLDLVEEVTPWEDLEKLEMARLVQQDNSRQRTGRPTKKQRRDIDRISGCG